MTPAVSERDPLPARAHDLRSGTEAGIEVNGRLHRPNDRVQRNHFAATRRFQPACAIVHSRRIAGPSLSLEPASDPSDGMRPPGAAEVSLRVEGRHPGGVSGERPEHFATTISAGRRAAIGRLPIRTPYRSPRFPSDGRLER